MVKKIAKFIIYISIPIIIGGISSLLTSTAMMEYADMPKPPLSPPGSLFPFVWTALYILMGIGAYIIIESKYEGMEKTVGLILYYMQLFMNFVWSLIFFRSDQYFGAFIWLAIMWIVIALMLANYFKVSKLAFFLNVPLFCWVTFAGYLNFSVALMI